MMWTSLETGINGPAVGAGATAEATEYDTAGAGATPIAGPVPIAGPAAIPAPLYAETPPMAAPPYAGAAIAAPP